MLAALLDLVLPATCAGCRSDGGPWCGSCTEMCAPAARLTRPTPCPGGFPTTAAAADYDGVVREALLAHKEHGRRAARPALAALLAAAVELVAGAERPGAERPGAERPGAERPGAERPGAERSGAERPGAERPGAERPGAERSGPQRLLLVPVPSSAAAVRARGGDPVHALTGAARVLLARRGVGDRRVQVVRGLSQTRSPDDQAGLTAEQRASNLEGVLTVTPAARRQLSRGRVIIVDDVCTTGATLREAARALRCAGIAESGAAVVAATIRQWCPP